MRNYSNLSDHDFEFLVADLLGAEHGRRYELFARGADRGVDLRSKAGQQVPQRYVVVQCKHMRNSSFSKLETAAKKEKDNLDALGIDVSRYYFVTTQELTQVRKKKLATALGAWLQDEEDVLGAEDLELLLNTHSEVERSHVKLYLQSVGSLSGIVHSGTWSRSQLLSREITRYLPLYVETGAFRKAQDKLLKERSLIIAGPPGIGKTTLARMLLADAVRNEYEPIEVSRDVEEAFDVLNQRVHQVFYYDDFLGDTFLQDRLAKNEDRRLTSLIAECRRSDKTLFVLTTRDHILRQATRVYEEFQRAGLEYNHFLLTLTGYSDLDKARILYNHLWHSEFVTDAARLQIAEKGNYLEIVRHEYYNPRHIEYITGLAYYHLTASDNDNFFDFAKAALDDPSVIWRHAFERQLDRVSRELVLATAPLMDDAEVESVKGIARSLCSIAGEEASEDDLHDGLGVVEDTFVRVNQNPFSGLTRLTLVNPSVSDYLAARLRSNELEARRVIDGAQHYEQLAWLRSSVVEKAPLRMKARLRRALSSAAKRCFDCPSPRDQALGSNQSVYDQLARVAFYGSMCNDGAEYLEELGSWVESRVSESLAEYIGLGSHLRSLGALAIELKKAGLATREVDAIQSHLLDAADGPSEWEPLLTLTGASSEDATGPASSVAEKFESWATNKLEHDVDSLSNCEDVVEIQRLAAEVGIFLDEDMCNEAYAHLEEREREDESDSSSYQRGSTPGERIDKQHQEQQMKALFELMRDGIEQDATDG